MTSKKTVSTLMNTGIMDAISATLCCTTPMLAFFGGVSGYSSAFSWAEPFRLLLTGLTVMILAFTWYQQLYISRQNINCGCEDETCNTKFIHSKKFLGILTTASFIMIAFPYYSGAFAHLVELALEQFPSI